MTACCVWKACVVKGARWHRWCVSVGCGASWCCGAQADGATVLFLDGKQGKLYANLHGTYYVKEASQIRNYKNIAEAMAAVYHYAK